MLFINKKSYDVHDNRLRTATDFTLSLVFTTIFIVFMLVLRYNIMYIVHLYIYIIIHILNYGWITFINVCNCMFVHFSYYFVPKTVKILKLSPREIKRDKQQNFLKYFPGKQKIDENMLPYLKFFSITLIFSFILGS